MAYEYSYGYFAFSSMTSPLLTTLFTIFSCSLLVLGRLLAFFMASGRDGQCSLCFRCNFLPIRKGKGFNGKQIKSLKNENCHIFENEISKYLLNENVFQCLTSMSSQVSQSSKINRNWLRRNIMREKFTEKLGP